jgi:hypothetical protein
MYHTNESRQAHFSLLTRHFPLLTPPVSRKDDPVHGWLRRAVTHPDFAHRLVPLAIGDREIVLDHSAEASHAFFAAMVCLAAKDRKKPAVLAGL